MNRGLWKYGAIRLMLWASVVIIAWLPTIANTKGPVRIETMFAAINTEGGFRDLFFALVPAAAVSISSTLDFFCASRDADESLSAALALLANVGVLASGLVGFLMIPNHTVLDGDQYALYRDVIVVGLFLSLVTELWVSVANEKRRKLLERNWAELPRVKARLEMLQRLGQG